MSLIVGGSQGNIFPGATPSMLYLAADTFQIPLTVTARDKSGGVVKNAKDTHGYGITGEDKIKVGYGPFRAVHTVRVLASFVNIPADQLALLVKGPGKIGFFFAHAGTKTRLYLLDLDALPDSERTFTHCPGLMECHAQCEKAIVKGFRIGKKDRWEPLPKGDTEA